MLILIILLILVLGGFGGFYGGNLVGPGYGLGGSFGLIVFLFVIAYFLGAFRQ